MAQKAYQKSLSNLENKIGDKNILNRRTVQNPKYAKVKSSINTGATAKNAPVYSDQMIAKRRSERFKRIKCSTLARLLRESLAEESIYQLNRDGGNGEVNASDSVSQMGAQRQIMGGPGGAAQQQMNNASMGRPGVGRSAEESKDTESVYSMRSGVSVGTAVTYATDMLGITANTTFLLLDLRDPDEYETWRIKESINFPAANIARDRTIPELYRFKNAPDKLIICYMNDERQGVQQATLLAEKGYENTFLLSGGIEAFLEENQDLVEGRQVPTPKRAIQAAEEAKAAEQKAQRRAKHQNCMPKF